ncbi:MAG: M48 family metalloprotease [bacterium]
MNIQDEIQRNNLKVYFLMTVLVALLTSVGAMVSYVFNWGNLGVQVFIIFSMFINVIAYFFSDSIVLKMSHAVPMMREDAPEIYSMIQNLTLCANLPMPKVYLLEDRTMNAFATGRNKNHSAIALTRGLLEHMSHDEVEGVIAHEVSHIKNGDMRLMTIVAVVAGFITLVADAYWLSTHATGAERRDSSGILGLIGIFLSVLAPITAFFIQLAVSRGRETKADLSAAALTHKPLSLALALEKISRDARLPEHISSATAHLYLSSPAHGTTFIDRMFSTHPPVEERIALLRAIK